MIEDIKTVDFWLYLLIYAFLMAPLILYFTVGYRFAVVVGIEIIIIGMWVFE